MKRKLWTPALHYELRLFDGPRLLQRSGPWSARRIAEELWRSYRVVYPDFRLELWQGKKMLKAS